MATILTSTTAAPSSAVAAARPPLNGSTNVLLHSSSSAAAQGSEFIAPHHLTQNYTPGYYLNHNGHMVSGELIAGGHHHFGNFCHQGYVANHGPADSSRRVHVGPSYPHVAQPFILPGQIVTPREALQFASSAHLFVMNPIDRQLNDRILKQIEHYFSYENLVKDLYLRSKMDDEGWVPINVITGFRRVKEMADDIRIILEALKHSDVVHVEGEKIRKRHGWQIWLLPPSFDISGL